MPAYKMPKCTNCNGKMYSMFIRHDGSNREKVGYLCKSCKAFLFIIEVGKELDVIYKGLIPIKSKRGIW
ncbi:MAG: hypothetical protein ACFE8A_13350 [Candidatus Hodarchaeota archaeon]